MGILSIFKRKNANKYRVDRHQKVAADIIIDINNITRELDNITRTFKYTPHNMDYLCHTIVLANDILRDAAMVHQYLDIDSKEIFQGFIDSLSSHIQRANHFTSKKYREAHCQ